MKIALLGYGKMGHEVEKTAIEQGHTIGLIVDNENDWPQKVEKLKECDVAIEFSIPTTTVENMRRCFELQVPVVVGTTGWYDHFQAVTDMCLKSNGTLFYASNFSIGINIFSDINRRLASLLEKYPMYLPSVAETHHTRKLDSPSGTAISLVNDIINSNSLYKGYSAEVPEAGKIPVESIREGNVTGIHTISWNSEVDQITITHEAKNRRGFALGALMAALWVKNRKGVFSMKDMLDLGKNPT